MKLTKDIPVLLTSEKAKDLAKGYIAQDIIPEKHIEDALHVAIASLNKLDFFVPGIALILLGPTREKRLDFTMPQQAFFVPR